MLIKLEDRDGDMVVLDSHQGEHTLTLIDREDGESAAVYVSAVLDVLRQAGYTITPPKGIELEVIARVLAECLDVEGHA